MKQTIRFNTFETNSSSTHSCIIVTDEELEKWRNGETYVDWSGNFHTKEELLEEYNRELDKSQDFEDWLLDNDYRTYENWGDEYEGDTTTREINGVKVHAVCYYGQDY